MRPIYYTVEDGDDSPVIPLDYMANPFNVTIAAIIGAGTVDGTIEFTLDDVTVEGYDASTGNWFPMTSMTAVTADQAGTLVSPVRAIRWVNNSGTDDVLLQIVQSGWQG